jgi:hypothetical protein
VADLLPAAASTAGRLPGVTPVRRMTLPLSSRAEMLAAAVGGQLGDPRPRHPGAADQRAAPAARRGRRRCRRARPRRRRRPG